MDPCPFVRVLVGNLALKLPPPSTPSASSSFAASGSGVHPTTAPCYCRIRLNNLPHQTASAPLLPATEDGPASCTGAFAAAFHVSKADLDRAAAKAKPPVLLFDRRRRRIARLKVAVYAGRAGTRTSGRLIGKLVVPVDLAAAMAKPVVVHSGWVAIGNKRPRGKGAAVVARAQLNLTVRAEPDPRFVFEFDGEPECSPRVLQVKGSMKQPVFTCNFSCRSSSSESLLRSRSSVRSDPGGGARSWLARLGSERGLAGGKERKGWSVTVHDLSGSPVALASMVTPFVASPGTGRVSRSNPGAWLVLRPVDGTWTPWGRLECWRERSGSGDALGYRFELVVPDQHTNTGVCVAESGVSAARGGRFAIDLTAAQPFGSPGCGSGDLGHGLWPFGTFRGFVMSADVQGEGRRSRGRRRARRVRRGCGRVRGPGGRRGPQHGRVQAVLLQAPAGAVRVTRRAAPVTSALALWKQVHSSSSVGGVAAVCRREGEERSRLVAKFWSR